MTRVTPTTRPIVERVVRSGSSTALRPATRATGPVPSSRLTIPTSHGMTNRAPTSSPVPATTEPANATMNPAGVPPSSPTSAARASRPEPPAIISPASAARTTDVRRRRTGATDDPDRAAAGVTRRIRRDPTHPATTHAGVMVTTGRTSSVLANG